MYEKKSMEEKILNFNAWLKQRVEWQTSGANRAPTPDAHGTVFRAIEAETILFEFEKVVDYMLDQQSKGG